MTSRDYCFTSFAVNNFGIKENEETVKYLVYQTEVCPDTAKEHIQGFVRFNKPVRMPHVKKTFADNALHVETRKGTPAQVRAEPVLRRAEPVLRRAETMLCPCCPHFLNPLGA